MAQIGFVGGHFLDREVLRGRLNERLELRGIGSVHVVDFDGGHDMRLRPAHRMGLHPIVAAPGDAIFFIEPAHKSRAREARRIRREHRFHGPQRQAALHDQVLQDRRQRRVFEVVIDAHAVHQRRQIALVEGVFQVAREAP